MTNIFDKVSPYIEKLLPLFTDLVEVLTDWPLLLFLFLFIYRKQLFSVIPSLLLKLADRISSISAGAVSVDFNDLKNSIAEITDPDLNASIIKSIDTRIVGQSTSIDEDENSEDDLAEIEIEDEDEDENEEDYKKALENLKKGE